MAAAKADGSCRSACPDVGKGVTVAEATVSEPQQQPPGTLDAMRRKPDHGEDSYRGSGRLAGKKAIITGGDSGIGRAVAIAFAREGADVLIAYLNEHDDAQETAQAGREGRPPGRPGPRRPRRPGRTAGRSSTARSRSSAASTCWSTTPPTR